MKTTQLKVNSKSLAFYEDVDKIFNEEVSRYLSEDEKVVFSGNIEVWGGAQGDKEYCRVYHPVYGKGYVLAEGLTALNES